MRRTPNRPTHLRRAASSESGAPPSISALTTVGSATRRRVRAHTPEARSTAGARVAGKKADNANAADGSPLRGLGWGCGACVFLVSAMAACETQARIVRRSVRLALSSRAPAPYPHPDPPSPLLLPTANPTPAWAGRIASRASRRRRRQEWRARLRAGCPLRRRLPRRRRQTAPASAAKAVGGVNVCWRTHGRCWARAARRPPPSSQLAHPDAKLDPTQKRDLVVRQHLFERHQACGQDAVRPGKLGEAGA